MQSVYVMLTKRGVQVACGVEGVMAEKWPNQRKHIFSVRRDVHVIKGIFYDNSNNMAH